MKKKELIFIAGILILAGVLWLGFQIAGKRSHNTIRITVDGKEFGTYSLSQDQIIHIDHISADISHGFSETVRPEGLALMQKPLPWDRETGRKTFPVYTFPQ